jgi:hypothetical protein
MATLPESLATDEADTRVVEPHTVELTVWDVPPTVASGEHFTFSAGARCSAGCDLGGRELDLFDHQGAPAATVKLGHEVWPGTEALYFAHIEANAPLEAGSHPWQARIAGWHAEHPHASGSFPLIMRVVTMPDCAVTIRAIDREKQTPIQGARVVMHPYRAVTDGNGIATIRVAKGSYEMLVSGSKYLPACASVEVTADMVSSAELEADQPWTPPDEDLS